MVERSLSDLFEDAVRLRSYLIWEREGCCDGNALDHWLRAKVELDVELRALPPLRNATSFVMPRLPISRPPCRRIAMRISAAR